MVNTVKWLEASNERILPPSLPAPVVNTMRGFCLAARAFRCLVSCMNELSTNLGTVFLARLAVGNLSEVLLPILKVGMTYWYWQMTCITKKAAFLRRNVL